MVGLKKDRFCVEFFPLSIILLSISLEAGHRVFKLKKRRKFGMKKASVYLFCMALLVSSVTGSVFADETLKKIEVTGKFIVGARQDAAPFGFYDKEANWVGFSLDIAKEIHKRLEEELGKNIELEFKPTLAKTRISLLVAGATDMQAGCSTHNLRREEVVDYSITYFVTGLRLLVRKGSGIKEVEDLRGKGLGSVTGTTNINALREMNEKEGLGIDMRAYDKETIAFVALQEGEVDAIGVDDVLLAGLKAKAANPGDWEIVGRLLSYEPYGYMVRENDSDFRDFVNMVLVDLIKSGKFYEIYEKWLGTQSEVPFPMSDDYKTLLELQCWPY